MRVITYAHVWSNDASPRFIRYLPYLAAGCGAGSAARRKNNAAASQANAVAIRAAIC